VELGAGDGDVESADEVEGVVAGERGDVEVFGKDEGDEDEDGEDDAARGEVVVDVALRGLAAGVVLELLTVPAADPEQDGDAEEGGKGEPEDSALADGEDEDGGEEGADGGAGVAADLEEGLGEAVASAGGHAGDAGGLWMEDGGADAEEGCGDEQQAVGGGVGEHDEADEGDGHADGQRNGRGAAIGEVADEGLEEGCGDLESKGDEADLGEVELELGFEDGVNGGQDGLHHVIDEVAKADGGEDAEERGGGLGVGVGRELGCGGSHTHILRNGAGIQAQSRCEAVDGGGTLLVREFLFRFLALWGLGFWGFGDGSRLVDSMVLDVGQSIGCVRVLQCLMVEAQFVCS